MLVSLSAVTLRERQETNRRLDRQRNILMVAGLAAEDERLTAQKAGELFREHIEPRLIDLRTGEEAAGIDPSAYDQRRALADPAMSMPAPANDAKVVRLPRYGLIHFVRRGGALEGVVLPVEGKGLWSTIYGYLALEPDLRTIKGITFYEHGETPGLGGEIENARWRASWRGKRAFDEEGRPVFQVKKGLAGTDPHAVDGLAGATLTARGVMHLVRFWLGESGYGGYLRRLALEAAGPAGAERASESEADEPTGAGQAPESEAGGTAGDAEARR